MTIIWRDRYFFTILVNISCLVSLIYTLIVIIKNFNAEFFMNLTIITYMFYLLIILVFLNSLRMKLTYLTNEGIRIENTPDSQYITIKLKQKPRFFRWAEIEYLKLICRHQGPYGYIINLLVLNSKSGKKYECWISKPQKFINKLSEINKKNLLTKDSRFWIFQELHKI